MAKQGRPTSEEYYPWDAIPSALIERINDVIDSHQDLSATDIYERFALASRFDRPVSFHTLRRYVSDRRNSGAEASETQTEEAPSWEALDERMRRVIAANIDAGDVKTYEAVGVLRAVFDKRRVSIEEEANRRAQEKHNAEMRERQRKFEEIERAAQEGEFADMSEVLAHIRQDLFQLPARRDEAVKQDEQYE